MPENRSIAAALAAALLACGLPAAAQPASTPMPASAPATASRSLAVLDFELVDEQNNPATKAAQLVRLRNVTAQMGRELAAQQLYRVVDATPSQALQTQLRSQQEYLYRCDDCAEQIGKQLGVDLVMATWVQKVSELILNLNVQIYDVKAQKVVLSKSVDMRGNDDSTWARAVSFLVRDMADKRQKNPRYGQ